jgi:3-deoxy-7-phosphoheptulonate synthase
MHKKDFHVPLLIDCSHGNSLGDALKQKKAFKEAILQIKASRHPILGVMLESHLKGGKQPMQGRDSLVYGCSVTDPCLDFESTKELLCSGDELFSSVD